MFGLHERPLTNRNSTLVDTCFSVKIEASELCSDLLYTSLNCEKVFYW